MSAGRRSKLRRLSNVSPKKSRRMAASRRPDKDRRCRRAPRIRPVRAPSWCGNSRCFGRSSAADRAGCGRPGPSVSTRPSNSLRGGTRCTSALTVVSRTMSPPSCSSPIEGEGFLERGAFRQAGSACRCGGWRFRRSERRGHRAGDPRRERSASRFWMKKGEGGGEARHPPVIAADMQPRPAPLSASSVPIVAASWPSGAPNSATARGCRASDRPNSARAVTSGAAGSGRRAASGSPRYHIRAAGWRGR